MNVMDGEIVSRIHNYQNLFNYVSLLTETDGRGNSYVYTYDAASNLTSSTDPLGNKTCYSYDIYGRCVKVTDPKGNSTAYAYDGNGNCIRQTDELGTVTEMTYDALNRLTKTCIKTSEGENTDRKSVV